MDDKSVTSLFTFGYSQLCPYTGKDLGDHYALVTAPDRSSARLFMNTAFKRNWAFEYDGPGDAKIADYVPRMTLHLTVNLVPEQPMADDPTGQTYSRADDGEPTQPIAGRVPPHFEDGREPTRPIPCADTTPHARHDLEFVEGVCPGVGWVSEGGHTAVQVAGGLIAIDPPAPPVVEPVHMAYVAGGTVCGLLPGGSAERRQSLVWSEVTCQACIDRVPPEGFFIVAHGPVKPPYGTPERETYDRDEPEGFAPAPIHRGLLNEGAACGLPASADRRQVSVWAGVTCKGCLDLMPGSED